jgi:hypothetical protein
MCEIYGTGTALCFLADIECDAFWRSFVGISINFGALGGAMAAYSACSSSSLLFTAWRCSSSEFFSIRGGRSAFLANARVYGLHRKAVALPSKLWRRPFEGKELLASSLSVNASSTSVQGMCHG